jgi:hypothetical protein
MKRVLWVCLLAVVGCQLPADPPPTAPDKTEADYTRWPAVTDKPYPVDAPFAAMCAISPSPESEKRRREELAKTHGPHAVHAISVRVSPTGRSEFMARTPVPVGTVVVKEKLADEKVVAVGTMTKREPGYDPDHGDWEYGYRELKPDAPPAAAGKIDSCIACHRIASQKDYLYRPYLKPAR